MVIISRTDNLLSFPSHINDVDRRVTWAGMNAI